jgi:hypothetical protein
MVLISKIMFPSYNALTGTLSIGLPSLSVGTHMDIVGLFRSDSDFPLDVAAIRAVIVTHEQAHFIRQGQNLLDTVIQHRRVTARKIRPRRTTAKAVWCRDQDA